MQLILRLITIVAIIQPLVNLSVLAPALFPQHERHGSDPEEEGEDFENEADDGADGGAPGERVGF